MKNLIIGILTSFISISIVQSQNHHNHSDEPNQTSNNVDLGNVNDIIKGQINQVLTIYYEVKTALVGSNGKTAKIKAGALVQLLSKVETGKMTEEQKVFFTQYAEKIKFDAEHINETEDAGHQRDHLNDLSNNIWAITKAFKANSNPVYQQYCPMKKTYWMSNEQGIKNPYYGNQMLTCGKITETLK